MDHKFTQKIREWLEQPHDERDYSVGALYLLKLSGNQIMYRNLIANPSAKADFIEYQIQKYYNFRVQALTHEQVEDMAAQVKTIADEHHLTDDASTEPEDERRLGKREDHDALPDEVKAKYVENLSLLQRMRELHLKLRSLSLDTAPCPDSERYPFLKELIDLDKKMHANWEEYDHFVATAPSAKAAASSTKSLGSDKKPKAGTKK